MNNVTISSLPETNWDWRNMLPSSIFHAMLLDGMPGWERDSGIYQVRFSIIKGVSSSRQIATWWDDLATGQFYYRDFTDSGLPFVDDGEVYKSSFYFQFKHDAIRFTEWLETGEQHGIKYITG